MDFEKELSEIYPWILRVARKFCCSIIHPDHAVCFREQIQAVGDEKDNAVRYHLTQVFKHFYFCCLV